MTFPHGQDNLERVLKRLRELNEEAVGLVDEIERSSRYGGHKLGDGLKAVLRRRDTPQRAREIARELWEGGIATSSDFATFAANVEQRLWQWHSEGSVELAEGGFRWRGPGTSQRERTSSDGETTDQ